MSELTDSCNRFYQLNELHAQRERDLDNMVLAAPHYNGETVITEIDAIISYYREAQAAKTELEETYIQMKNAQSDILTFMEHFGIPAGIKLSGAIPEELEYEIWADDDNNLQTRKTKNLAADDNPNMITIKFSNGGN